MSSIDHILDLMHQAATRGRSRTKSTKKHAKKPAAKKHAKKPAAKKHAKKPAKRGKLTGAKKAAFLKRMAAARKAAAK